MTESRDVGTTALRHVGNVFDDGFCRYCNHALGVWEDTDATTYEHDADCAFMTHVATHDALVEALRAALHESDCEDGVLTAEAQALPLNVDGEGQWWAYDEDEGDLGQPITWVPDAVVFAIRAEERTLHEELVEALRALLRDPETCEAMPPEVWEQADLLLGRIDQGRTA